jgi:hypothetical protein
VAWIDLHLSYFPHETFISVLVALLFGAWPYCTPPQPDSSRVARNIFWHPVARLMLRNRPCSFPLPTPHCPGTTYILPRRKQLLTDTTATPSNNVRVFCRQSTPDARCFCRPPETASLAFGKQADVYSIVVCTVRYSPPYRL